MNFKSFIAAAPLLVAFASPSYAANPVDPLNDFRVNEDGVIPAALGSFFGTFEADKITGGYTEVFTATSATTFAVSAYVNLTGFFKNDGQTSIAGAAVNSLYQLYGVFQGTGDIILNSDGSSTLSGKTGTVSMWADPFVVSGSLTTFASATSGLFAPTLGNNADDIKLFEATDLLFGNGHNFPGSLTGANGDFSITMLDLALTNPKGKAYFYEPDPFYPVITFDGNFSSFPIPAVGQSATIQGAANIFFEKVPEPSSLALLGLGALSLGARKRKA